MWGAELTLSPANSTSAASTAEGQSSGAPRAQAGAGSAPGQETVVFSTPAIHATKKAARQAAARDAIMSLDRPLYDKVRPRRRVHPLMHFTAHDFFCLAVVLHT